MWYSFCFYFLLFFIYSVIGWVIETIVCSCWAKKKVLNRGFLIGPYIPIYGTAALFMILFLSEYKSDIFVLFCMACVYASFLEYFTSFWMEKLFHARWWDYSDKKFNLNGRICLENSISFGVLGVLLILFINPLIEGVLHLLPSFLLTILALVALFIFLSDVLLTVVILSRLDIQVKNIRSDATEEIDQEFQKILRQYRVLYNRLFDAFPKIEFTRGTNGAKIVRKVRKKLKEWNDSLAEKKRQIRKKKREIRRLRKEKADRAKIQLIKDEMKEIRKAKIK